MRERVRRREREKYEMFINILERAWTIEKYCEGSEIREGQRRGRGTAGDECA